MKIVKVLKLVEKGRVPTLLDSCQNNDFNFSFQEIDFDFPDDQSGHHHIVIVHQWLVIYM